MLFLIDAQLPPALADALRDAGCDAVHVADLGLLTATDRQIWDAAISCSAVLVTKDRDFPVLRAASESGPIILWVRTGNISNQMLIERMIRTLTAISEAIARGETIIEWIGR